MKNQLIIVGIIALLVGSGAGFIGGMQYQKSKVIASTNQLTTRTGGRRFGANGNGAIRGTIISKDNNSITVKLADNSTKIVILSNSTTIGKSTQGTIDDVNNGSNVMVFGTPNSDGTLTAQMIQVGGSMFGGPRPSGSPEASPTNQSY